MNVINLIADRESVTEFIGYPLPDGILKTVDAYTMPSGIIRVHFRYRGKRHWHNIDYAAIHAGIAAGHRGWEIKRIE